MRKGTGRYAITSSSTTLARHRRTPSADLTSKAHAAPHGRHAAEMRIVCVWDRQLLALCLPCIALHSAAHSFALPCFTPSTGALGPAAASPSCIAAARSCEWMSSVHKYCYVHCCVACVSQGGALRSCHAVADTWGALRCWHMRCAG